MSDFITFTARLVFSSVGVKIIVSNSHFDAKLIVISVNSINIASISGIKPKTTVLFLKAWPGCIEASDTVKFVAVTQRQVLFIGSRIILFQLKKGIRGVTTWNNIIPVMDFFLDTSLHCLLHGLPG